MAKHTNNRKIKIIDKSTDLYLQLNNMYLDITPYEHIKFDEYDIGASYKNLTVIKIINRNKSGSKYIFCKCKCGNIIRTSYSLFKNHNNRNCGCMPHIYKHGESRDRIYRIWQNINYRCNYKNSTSYKKYGAKGIFVCDEWDMKNKDGFINFSKWAHSHGYRDDLTIDRINETESYSPNNCKWTTYKEQNSHLGMLKNNKSGYKGVSWDKVNKKWLVVISINNKTYHIGRFNNKKDAVNARNKYIDEHGLLHKKQNYIGEEGYIHGYSY